MMCGAVLLIVLHTEFGMVSGPEADDGEEHARAHSISVATSSGHSLNGRRMEAVGARGASGKKRYRRALFSLSGAEAPGSSGKRGGGRLIANFLAVHTVCGVAVARKELQWSLFACLMALKYEEQAALAEAYREASKRSSLEDLRAQL